jgi:hypothetical protein
MLASCYTSLPQIFETILKLGILRQSRLLHLQHLDPISPDLRLLPRFGMRFGFSAFLFRRQFGG